MTNMKTRASLAYRSTRIQHDNYVSLLQVPLCGTKSRLVGTIQHHSPASHI